MTIPPPSIDTIDCHYHDEPERAAAFLTVSGDRAVFVDTNTNHAVPRLLAALRARNLTPEQVDYVIITHAHLDHAAGTAALLRHCPNATVLAHPKAARHLIDPSRLIAGTRVVYGEAVYARLYGDIDPVPEDRVRTVEDGEHLDWNGRMLTFLHTRGHASHHICIHDAGANALFAGDTFGLGRMTAMRPGPPFTVCTSSPPEFDPDEARRSVTRLLETGAEWVYITHYGHFDDLPARAAQLRDSIGHMEAIGRAAAQSDLAGEALTAYCTDRVREALGAHLHACSVDDPEADLEWLHRDVDLNGMGLAIYAERLRKAAAEA